MDKNLKILVISFSLIISLGFFSQSSTAVEEEDDLLLTIVPILAATRANTEPLSEIKALAGDWVIEAEILDYPKTDFYEFRFYENTARSLDSTYGYIEGDRFFGRSDFAYIVEGESVSAVYDKNKRLYTITSVRKSVGESDFDIGLVFIINSLLRNTEAQFFDCRHITDSQGNIPSYYEITGGPIPCDRITKVRYLN